MPFGHEMRDTHFNFAKGYRNLNHGSYGAFPSVVRDYQRELQGLIEARPDHFIRYSLPKLLIDSRAAIAPLLGVSTDEVVIIPNATTGVNTVLRNLIYQDKDVILYFSTAYGACDKSINYICETTKAVSKVVVLEYPIEDEEILNRFKGAIEEVEKEGMRVKLAMFDTVLTFPGARMPWEALVQACRNSGILSLIDGAHGIGHIDLTKLGEVSPDFFVSNCYK